MFPAPDREAVQALLTAEAAVIQEEDQTQAIIPHIEDLTSLNHNLITPITVLREVTHIIRADHPAIPVSQELITLRQEAVLLLLRILLHQHPAIQAVQDQALLRAVQGTAVVQFTADNL